MAYLFGDGFDLYAAPADANLGYWDGGASGAPTIVAGRFSGSRAMQLAATGLVFGVKNSTATTDPVHHISCAFNQTNTITGTTIGTYFQLSDGATNQVCICFRSDGAILLTSATPGGTVLDTWSGAIPAANVWNQFEFEVVIHPSAGSWAIRKNGNTSNDHALGSLNTRPGANTQANKLTFGMATSVSNTHQVDDVLWRSDASSVSWAGDIRCFTRMPVTDASAQWTKSATSISIPSYTGGSTTANTSNGQARFSAFTSQGSSIGSVILSLSAGLTGNMKCALYASSAGQPGAVLQSAANIINNPTAGATNTFTFSPPVSVTPGAQYFAAFCPDTSAGGVWGVASSGPYASNSFWWTGTYAGFPANNPPVTISQATVLSYSVLTAAANANLVGEPQQDGTTTYIYDSNVGDADLYNIASIGSTPATVVAVTTRALLQKSDAGTRNVTVDLKSGGTTVHSTSTALNTTWGWVYRTDTTDPATGSAWTATGVANAQVGATVSA